MCQLTFINGGNEKINKRFFESFTICNTFKDHQDGFGIYTNGEIRKEKKSPWEYLNYMLEYEKMITESPVILHVRKTSLVNNNKDENLNFSHPFESRDLIFAHNGTLNKKISSVIVDKTKIDSQIFLGELENNYNGEIVPSLIKTMKEFEGKFAFLIFEKKKNNFYAVKGKTATLYYFKVKNKDGKELGYFVNTEKESLERSIMMGGNYLRLDNIEIDVNEEIKELEDESIFLLGKNEIKKIGEIKENVAEKTWGSWKRNSTTGFYVRETDKNAEKIVNFMTKWGLTAFEINELFSKIFKTSILGAMEKEIEDFIMVYIPLLEKEAWKKNKKKFIDKKGEINKSGLVLKMYENVEFPYILEKDTEKFMEIKCQN